MVGTFGGLAVLRAPFSLGPLERLRELEIFQVLRTAPLSVLIKLAGLRIAFVLVFVGMGRWGALGVQDPRASRRDGSSACPPSRLVGALPIAVAGLGTVQVAAVELFENWAHRVGPRRLQPGDASRDDLRSRSDGANVRARVHGRGRCGLARR